MTPATKTALSIKRHSMPIMIKTIPTAQKNARHIVPGRIKIRVPKKSILLSPRCLPHQLFELSATDRKKSELHSLFRIGHLNRIDLIDLYNTFYRFLPRGREFLISCPQCCLVCPLSIYYRPYRAVQRESGSMPQCGSGRCLFFSLP